MNYKPFSGWWFYGATSATERANYFASWGLMSSLPTPTPVVTVATRRWPWQGLKSKWDCVKTRWNR